MTTISSSDDAVTIRIEIRVPKSGPPIITAQEDHPVDVRNIIVSEPPGPVGGTPPTVRVREDSDGVGYICAFGTAERQGQPPMHVSAKVYHGLVAIPSSPPASDPLVKMTAPSGTYWEFSHLVTPEIPNALCNAGGTAENTLAVWAYFDGIWEAAPRHFLGICSNQTECEASGCGFSKEADQAKLKVPDKLLATVTKKSGKLKDLPDKLILAKAGGKLQWVWTTVKPRPLAIALVADSVKDVLCLQLRCLQFHPSMQAPRPGSSVFPFKAVFHAKGKGVWKGSATLAITNA